MGRVVSTAGELCGSLSRNAWIRLRATPKTGQRQPSVTQGSLTSGPNKGPKSESRSQFGWKVVKIDMLDIFKLTMATAYKRS